LQGFFSFSRYLARTFVALLIFRHRDTGGTQMWFLLAIGERDRKLGETEEELV
jgi:hypothetical protein